MPDWNKSMQQTFEFCSVDPFTWRDNKILDNIKSCTINWDSSADTLGSATIDADTELSEGYVRVYLVTIQNGIRERTTLGTFLVQTPSVGFDGKVSSISIDAYTPLLELKEKMPPIGYAVLKNNNIMDAASDLCAENMRAPVVEAKDTTTLYDDFVADLNENWLSFLSALAAKAKYHFELDADGKLGFAPEQDAASLQPRWTYDDDNSSILYPELSIDRDLYGIPNVVEVVFSSGLSNLYARVENNDAESPVSTKSRGREIVYRETDPDIGGNPTQTQVKVYAEHLMRNLSSMEYTVTYKHGYCPVRVGDAVYLNYTRAGLSNVKAKVIRQSIRCETGCPVEETAVFTRNLWGKGG